MGLRPSLRRRSRRTLSTDLNLTPFIDILVCLILFLLVTAVLGKSAILNLYLPTEEDSTVQAQSQVQDKLIPSVAVTREGFILSNSKGGVVHIALKDGEYDYLKLREKLLELRNLPDYSRNIIILPVSQLRYQILISTMDICRDYEAEDGKIHPLFPTISLGEYRANPFPAKKGSS